MNRFFPAKQAGNYFLLLCICNLLFLVWLRHVGCFHEAIFFIPCTVATNALALYSNNRTAGPNAARNRLIANLGPILLEYGRIQTTRFMASCFMGSEAPAGSQWGNLITLLGAAMMMITVATAVSDAATDAFMFLIDSREDNESKAEKIKSFIFRSLKMAVFATMAVWLFFYWKTKNIEARDRQIRNAIQQADRNIATCDNNVRLSLEMGYGNEKQWREEAGRYVALKAKLMAELSPAKPAGNTNVAPGFQRTIPQPTNLSLHPFGPRAN